MFLSEFSAGGEGVREEAGVCEGGGGGLLWAWGVRPIVCKLDIGWDRVGSEH